MPAGLFDAPADDPRGFTYTEAHRHACEVRFVCSLPGPARVAFFAGSGDRPRSLESIRGADAAGRLAADVRAALDLSRAQRGKPAES